MGGTTIYGLSRNVPLHRVWLWRVSNVTFRFLKSFFKLFKLKQNISSPVDFDTMFLVGAIVTIVT